MEYLTVNQAANKYNVASDTVRKYLQSGKLRGQKIGNQWVITQGEAEKIPNLFYCRPKRTRTFAGDKSTLNDRDKKIVSLWEKGMTYQEIGDVVGLSRQRVNVILAGNSGQ